MKRTNALEVLAKRLKFHAEVAESGHALDDHASIDLDDAYHIVAELAKVEKPIDLRTVGMTHLADILDADKNRAVEIVRKCREIAEKGVKDVV